MEEQEVYLIAENDDGKVPENGDIVRDERTNRYYRLVRPAEEPILELWGKVKQAYLPPRWRKCLKAKPPFIEPPECPCP